MRKRVNKIDCSKLIGGLASGEHCEAMKEVYPILSKMCEGYVELFDVRLRPVDYPEELFYEIARTAKEMKLYFHFLYAYQFAPEGKRSHLDERIVNNIKKIAGEYFLGEIMGEAGSDRGAKAKGYFKEQPACMAEEMPPQNFADMAEAKEAYVQYVREMAEYNKKIGIEKPSLVEATALIKYDLEAGIEVPMLEFFPANPEELVAFTRGAAVGYGKDEWCGYIANEWYGGYRHEDKLKEKRLRLAYNYLFLSGATMVYLESGFTKLKSFGYDLPYESAECAAYRQEMQNFYRLYHEETRPSCGPVTKVAFLHGNLDGYTGFMGSSVWSQFDRKEWGKGAPENSWQILDEVYRSRDWHDFANFGTEGKDFSHAPAYGQYDVLPVESELSVMKNYDLLIFVGWNTMTKEIYEKLKEYVAGGGRLILSAAHLNTSARRGGEITFIDGGKLSDFLGCELTGISSTNDGVKFRRDGVAAGVQYPGTYDFICDCNYCSGYVNFVDVRMTDGEIVAFFEDKFAPAPESWEKVRPVLVGHKYGKGVVSLLTHVDYPGAPAAYPLYRAVVKENLTQTHRDCDLRVLCCDKVRFALFYEENGKEVLYLLNTDFNLTNTAKIEYKGKITEVSLASLELKKVYF
ncbi:MAG: hypothetical protein HFE26_02320 [Clostridia bacterium]|nr:hypothetical protein [Clostridia bacterium]